MSKKESRGYRPETLAKVTAAIMACIAAIIAAGYDKLRPRLIKGNKKIGRIWHFSTVAIAACANCAGCMHFCYELKAYLVHGSVLLSRCRNYVLMKYDRERAFDDIDKQLKRKKTDFKWFRWHVGGEILDYDYFCRMVKLAIDNPTWNFYTYTKMYGIVNTWIARHGGSKECLPDNLKIMFSEWEGMPMINPYGMPTFRTLMPGMKCRPHAWKCPGNCEDCVKAGRGCVVGEDTDNDLH